ncbi:MAG: carboxyl transferase domain-containing protein [Myxococcota bacterium]
MRLSLHLIGSQLDGTQDEREARKDRIIARERPILEGRAVVEAGWGEKYVHRNHQKGKLTTRERVIELIDTDSPIHQIGTFVNWGRRFGASEKNVGKLAPGAGVLTAFCKIENRWCMVIANENLVASGSWWPKTPEKIQRAQQMAMKLCVPVVYLVDCSGLFLPEQGLSFPGKTGAGHIFTMNARLSDSGIPQIAGVFGDCIAGGGYMPIISDRVYMTEQAYMVIAGAALIKGAKAQQLTSLDIGGPEVHVHQSGCGDVRVPNDHVCVSKIRSDIAKLPSSAIDYYRHGAEPDPPFFDVNELYHIFPDDHRHIYDTRQVIARLVDNSLVHEFLPHTGHEIFCGVARVSGLWMGFCANILEPKNNPNGGGKRPGGILYREGIAKLAAFSRSCNDDGIPIVWLQDIAGFDIGVEAEAQGLLGYGSSLIYTNSTNQTPMFTVLLRKASGAGYYAMAGLPYEPVVQLATAISRLAVMEGKTLAIASFRTKLNEDFEIAVDDPKEAAVIRQKMTETASRIEADMDPFKAASQQDTDELICLSELRGWLCALAEMSYQSIGTRRVKNPRIWSLHDWNVLAQPVAIQGDVVIETANTQSLVREEEVVEGAIALRAEMDGTFWQHPAPGEPAFAPPGTQVDAGQTVGLIEVMKTFSAIRAPAKGHILKWVVADGEPISSGDLLGWIEN